MEYSERSRDKIYYKKNKNKFCIPQRPSEGSSPDHFGDKLISGWTSPGAG